VVQAPSPPLIQFSRCSAASPQSGLGGPLWAEPFPGCLAGTLGAWLLRTCGMTREVRFCVTCADTRVGQHIRVVGSTPELGAWTPPQSPPLATTAADFPLWRSSVLIPVDEDTPVEYKYVICDGEGRAMRWEERANRSLHLAASSAQGVCPAGGSIAVVEGFNALDSPDASARFCGVERESSSSAAILRIRTQNYPEQEHPPAGGTADGRDMFEPTMRERCPSLSMLGAASIVPRRSSSLSHFGNLGLPLPPPTPADQSSAPEVTNAETPEAEARLGTDVNGVPGESMSGSGMVAVDSSGGLTSLVREESCSNLFLCDPEEAQVDTESREFEQRYALIGQGPLGEGTFGLVWRCIPKGAGVESTGPERAAKIVRKARLQPRDMRYLLGDDGEVSTHLTMKHPNIVELFEYFDEPQSVTLVLEFCRGGDLFDAIIEASKTTGRGFTEQAAAVATTHVLSALAYVHGQSVVHRDIKCENVLLSQRGGPGGIPAEENIFKLCDFGFAAHDNGEGFSDRLGSPDTVAPEVVAGTRYSFPADLWSTGTLVYMMLSATPPFYAPTDQDVLRKVRNGNYSLAGALWDSISAPPKHVITSLMTVDAKLRPTAQGCLQKAWLKDVPAVQ